MISSRVTLAVAALALCCCSAAAKPSTTPPSGLAFPPPASVTRYVYNGDTTKVSYAFKGSRLLGPFFRLVKKGVAGPEACATACAAWAPRDPVKGPYCRSWSFDGGSKACAFSERAGCTVYTVNPKKECVLWDAGRGATSGWVAVPLQ